ncbi:hypothetical protein HK104_006913, partial [Borealophlyctis nickersoniae]
SDNASASYAARSGRGGYRGQGRGRGRGGCGRGGGTSPKNDDSTANGSKIESSNVGDIPIRVAGDAAVLKDVLHVPDLSVNLMSVPAVNRKGIFVVFTPDEHVVFARDVDLSTARTLAEGTRDEGLYWFKGTLRDTEEEDGAMALLTKEE